MTNIVIIVGHLTCDPQLGQTACGKPIKLHAERPDLWREAGLA